MSNHSANARVLSSFLVDVLNPDVTRPIEPLKPVCAKDINFVCSKRADALRLAKDLEKTYLGEWFIVMPCKEVWQVINYDALSAQDQAWADEARGNYEYYVDLYV